tara:strand:+ start:763 stop:1212 length:450 start_codon:yes stop_codon:yes gene_type:complete
MDEINIKGVLLVNLKIINHPSGDILHAMKSTDDGFVGFKDAYFSTIHKGEIKGWKMHKKMTLNLIVPKGKVRFILFDNRMGTFSKTKYFSIVLSRKNYQRLTLPPGIWHAFRGEGKKENIILNISDMNHDPKEILRKDIKSIPINWDRI